MAKINTTIKLYRQQRKRVLRAIRELTKQGYVLDYEIPQIPAKITKKSVQSLSKITRSKLREKAIYIEEKTGEVKEAAQAFKEKRSEAAKKAAETRKANRERAYEQFDEEYGEYYPDESDIVSYNTLETIGRYVDLYEVLNYITTAKSSSKWEEYRSRRSWKKARAINASENAITKLSNYIRDLISKGRNIFLDDTESFKNALEKTLFGYDEQEVSISFYEVIRFLNGGVLTAEEAKNIEEMS